MINKTLIILALLSSGVFAMHIVYEPLDAVVKKSRCALLVEIQSVGSAQGDSFNKTIEIRAKPLKSIFGKMPSNEELSFIYSEGRPHVRGNTEVSPLVSGSGLEFNIKRMAKVIVLIDGNNNISKSLKVLRIEPEESAAKIISIIRLMKNAEQNFPADQQ